MKRLKEALKYLRDLFFAVAIAILIMPPICMLIAYILTHFYGITWPVPDEIDKLFMRLFAPAWYMILLKFIGVGCAEEGLFRQLLYNSFLTKTLRLPKILGLLISSIIFGAMHIWNPGGFPFTLPQAVGAAFAGVWFCYLYEKRGLTFAILTHGLYDFVVVMAAIYL